MDSGRSVLSHKDWSICDDDSFEAETFAVSTVAGRVLDIKSAI